MTRKDKALSMRSAEAISRQMAVAATYGVPDWVARVSIENARDDLEMLAKSMGYRIERVTE